MCVLVKGRWSQRTRAAIDLLHARCRGAKRWKANPGSTRRRQAKIWWVCIERDAS